MARKGNPDGEIRRATGEDRPRVLEVSRRTIRLAYAPILGQASVDRWTASAEHDTYYDKHEDTTWLITAGGAIAGVAALSANMLDLLLVDPDYQGRGLGSKLLAAMEDELFKKFDPIAVESWEGNHRANRFYLARGWQEISKMVDEQTKAPKILFMKGKSKTTGDASA